MSKAKGKLIDIDKLTARVRARVERALSPRDTVMSLRFSQASIDAWRQAAMTADESFTSWVERHLNAGLKK